MSIKSTLASGPNFHFYSEALNDDHVYLELESCRFEASDRHVMVEIPLAIWEVIRQQSIVDFSLTEKSDAELLAYVEAEVKNRMERYSQEDDRGKPIINLYGGGVYGPAETSKEEQITNGMKYFMKQRANQEKLRGDIEALKEATDKNASFSCPNQK